jgi:hypothetical protein
VRGSIKDAATGVEHKAVSMGMAVCPKGIIIENGRVAGTDVRTSGLSDIEKPLVGTKI